MEAKRSQVWKECAVLASEVNFGPSAPPEDFTLWVMSL